MNSNIFPNNLHIPLPVAYVPHPATVFCNQMILPTQKFDDFKEHIAENNNPVRHVEQTKVTSDTNHCVPPIRMKHRGHTCEICLKTFRQKAVLKTHMKVHSDTKEHQCPECKRGFTYKANLDVHMRIHSGEKPHRCPHCEKAFSQSNSLKYHLSVHTGYKPNVCPTCQKTFITRANLRDHMVSHTTDKPFHCDLCGHTFARKVSLRFHYRTHNNYKPYKCQYCELAYAAHSSLIYHNKKHCGPNSRDYHKIHNSNNLEDGVELDFLLEDEDESSKRLTSQFTQDDASFVCPICKKCFRYHFMYLKHTQTCFGTTGKYNCSECNNVFSDQIALYHHKAQHRLDNVAAERLHLDNITHAAKPVTSST